MNNPLTPEQLSAGYAFSTARERIVVDFGTIKDKGVVMSAITNKGEDGPSLYVVIFEKLGRMLVGAVKGEEFDLDICPHPQSWYLNPCGRDNIEDAGLDVSIFNTEYEGGLHEVVEVVNVEGAPSIERLQIRRIGKTGGLLQ